MGEIIAANRLRIVRACRYALRRVRIHRELFVLALAVCAACREPRAQLPISPATPRAVDVTLPPSAPDARVDSCVPRSLRAEGTTVRGVQLGNDRVTMALCRGGESDVRAQTCVWAAVTRGGTQVVRDAPNPPEPSTRAGLALERAGPSRFEVRESDRGWEVCASEGDSCTSIWLSPLDRTSSRLVTEDGRIVAYIPEGTHAVFLYELGASASRTIELPMYTTSAYLLGTAIVATECVDTGMPDFACATRVYSAARGRATRRLAGFATQHVSVVRIAPERWAVVDLRRGEFDVLRGDGARDGGRQTIAYAENMAEGGATMAVADDPAGYAVVVHDHDLDTLGNVVWYAWDGAAPSSSARVAWCP